MLTTTRRLAPEGLTEKTRELDVKGISRIEVLAMRELWANLQNEAFERADLPERVDRRSLAAQRAAALARGDERAAEALDRPAEVKLGLVASRTERRARRMAEREEREYVPVTERGEIAHAAQQVRALQAEVARLRDEQEEQPRDA